MITYDKFHRKTRSLLPFLFPIPSGLTDGEVLEAIRLADPASVANNLAPSSSPLLPPPLPPRPPSTPRFLATAPSRGWREYAVIAAVLGGMGYTLFSLVKVSYFSALLIPYIQLFSRFFYFCVCHEQFNNA